MRGIQTVGLFCLGFLLAQPHRPESDCSGAIRICRDVYAYPGGIPSYGTVQELSGGRGTCLVGGEHQTAWFIFTVQRSGTMGFVICPAAGWGARDYDFALWDVTDLPNPCSIFQGAGPLSVLPIRCNFSGDQGETSCCGGITCANPGLTGLDHTNVDPAPISYNAGQDPVMPGLPVQRGRTYLLLVDNFSNNNVGFTIRFYGTADYIDNRPPEMDSVLFTCSPLYESQLPLLERFRVRFNEVINPTTVAQDGSDFKLLEEGTGNVIAFTRAVPINPPQTRFVDLVPAQPLRPAQRYKLLVSYRGENPTDGNTILDGCGNAIPPGGATTAGDTLEFETPDTMGIEITTQPPRCPRTATGVIQVNVSGSSGPYEYAIVAGNSGAPPAAGWGPTTSWNDRTAGTYTIWIRNRFGCVQRRVVELADPQPVRLTVVDSQYVACGGEPIGFVQGRAEGGTPPYFYGLSPAPGDTTWQRDSVFRNLGTGQYQLFARDQFGCLSPPHSFRIDIYPPVRLVAVDMDSAYCNDPTGRLRVQATGGIGAPYTYTLNGTSNTTGDFPGLPAGSHRLTIQSGPCQGDTTLQVGRLPCVFVNVPTAFTPNGDGINDQWVISGRGVQRIEVTVWDRWGNQIWSNNGEMTRFWDGTTKSGQAVPEGVYSFLLRIVDVRGQEMVRTGTVTILR
ncbi:MAG: gliding motility-associated C-terminal domain-containing protein [Bacteroidia bacterium]|nr:gliding motility-associated C-terminal domain-containing protein [Bacteroidia bacterium]MDW8089071.1 gliding motility-associated C-terminal domain-containing protein [Bacteroidia bacterium]